MTTEPQDAAVTGSPNAGEPVTAAPVDGARAELNAELDAATDAESGDGRPGDAAFHLALPVFNGPLDLLLHLIEANQLEVTEVSLLAVTEQYLGFLRSREQIDLAALAEFIAIGARLLLLKSRALLPREAVPVDDDESDPQGDIRALVEALRDYRRFKQAALFLRDRDGGHGVYRREVAPPKVPMPTGLDTVTLSSLVDVIRDVIARLPEEEPEGEVKRDPIRLRDRVTLLVDRLDREGRTSFRRLIEGATSRTMVIVDFMAVLELIKQRFLTAQQSDAFGDIELVRLSGALRPDLAEAAEDFTGV